MLPLIATAGHRASAISKICPLLKPSSLHFSITDNTGKKALKENGCVQNTLVHSCQFEETVLRVEDTGMVGGGGDRKRSSNTIRDKPWTGSGRGLSAPPGIVK
jgi:hypothetical protein